MSPEQRQKLRSYAEREDREPEPVFVGREDLFDIVAKNVRGAVERSLSTGKTVCVTGPPGVGKSAFVNELKNFCSKWKFGGGDAHVVEINRADLHHPGCVLAAVANACADEGFKFNGRKLRERLKGFGIGFSTPGGGVRASLTWEPKSRAPFASFPVDLFREGGKTLLERGDAFILAVDEAQGIDPTPGSRANALLAHLHQGIDLPIVPVLAGLPNTQENLRETISRYSMCNEAFMVGLKDEESIHYVEEMLDWLGAEGTPAQREALADWIVTECGAGRGRDCAAARAGGQPGAKRQRGGWPHHL